MDSGLQNSLNRLPGVLCLLFALMSLPAFSSAGFGSLPSLRLPESMNVQIVGENIQMYGLKASVLQFESHESISKLSDFFVELWGDGVKQRRASDWHVLAHPEDGALITIQMRALQPGGVQGYIAVTDIFEAIGTGRESPAIDLPMLSGTHVLQDLRANDQGRHSRMLMLLSERSAHENLEFYRAHFKAEGFEPLGKRALFKGQNSGVMMLARGAERVNLTVNESDGLTLVTIVNIRN